MTEAQCYSRRGNVLPVDQSGHNIAGIQTTSTVGLDQLNPGWSSIMYPDTTFPVAIDALLQLAGSDGVEMVEALILSGANHTTGHRKLPVLKDARHETSSFGSDQEFSALKMLHAVDI